MGKDYSLEEIDNVTDVYLVEMKSEKRYEVENYMPKGGYSIHLYTYEEVHLIPGLNLCLVMIANNRKYISDELKLESIIGTFCTYRVRNVKFVEENKRQFKRVGYLKPVLYRVGNRALKADGVNLSAGGICMRSREQPSFRFCDIELNIDQKISVVKGQLVRFVKGEKDFMYTIHIKFLDVDRRTEQQLCSYVLRLEITNCREQRMRKTV